jgi:signal peptidase I
VTFWSTDGSASWVKPWTWFTALRGSRIGNGYSDKR